MSVKFAFTLFFSFLLVNISLASGPRFTLSQYLDTFSGIAIEEMQLHGIPASIKLAQGILESGFGNSELARYANNHFGIKCHGWQGRTMLRDDDKPNECFRAYNSALESFRDHSQFLRTRPWYAPLFQLQITDYEGWAHGLQRAGYATNPRYAEKLIRIIREHGLTHFDSIGLGLIPPQAPLHAAQPVAQAMQNQQSPPITAQTARTTAGNEIMPTRVVKSNNRIRFIIAFEGDTPESIAKEMGMRTWQIVRYNELDGSRTIVPGQIIYLQPKRRRGVHAFHIVQPGETLYDISQQHGIQLRFLMDRNNLEPWQTLTIGQRLLLKGRAEND